MPFLVAAAGAAAWPAAAVAAGPAAAAAPVAVAVAVMVAVAAVMRPAASATAEGVLAFYYVTILFGRYRHRVSTDRVALTCTVRPA